LKAVLTKQDKQITHHHHQPHRFLIS